MKSFNDCVSEYRKQVEKGDIVAAYRGLMEFMTSLCYHFKNKYSDYSMSISIFAITIALIIVQLLTSCSFLSKENSGSINLATNTDTISIQLKQKVDPVDSDQFFEAIEYVALETLTNSLISEISRIVIAGDRIFILDIREQAVQIFSIDGRHLARIQNIGRGPREYLSLMDITVDESTKRVVMLSDRPRAKLLFYDYDGNYIDEESIEYPPQGIIYSEGLRVIYRDFFRPDSNSNYTFAIRYPDGREEKMIPFKERTMTFAAGPRINASLGIHATIPHDPRCIIRIIGEEVTMPYYLDFGSAYLDPTTKDEELNMPILRYARENNKVISVVQIREYKNYLSFKTNNGGYFLYQKSNRRMNQLSLLRDINTGVIFSNYLGHQGKDEYMVFYSTSLSIINFTRYLNPLSTEAYYKLLKVAENIKEEDNPVLIICTMR